MASWNEMSATDEFLLRLDSHHKRVLPIGPNASMENVESIADYDSLEHLFSVSPAGIQPSAKLWHHVVSLSKYGLMPICYLLFVAPRMFEPSKHGSSSSGAAAEEIEDEDAEIDAAETVSDAETVAAEVNSADERTASGTFSGGEGMVAEASTEKDVVSIDELEAAEASFDDVPLASASNPRSIIITSSGGIAQGGLSGSGSHVDPSLLDSSPSTRQYVRRARRGSLVSTDSERTASVTARVPTPPSPLGESGGTAPTPTITTAVVSAVATIQGDETAPIITVGEVPRPVKGFLYTSLRSQEIWLMLNHAEVAASEEPVQADVTPGSGVPVIEEELAQDPVDDLEAGSETVAEEERRLQTAAVESAVRGSARVVVCCQVCHTRISVLADMDAFFREFDRTSWSVLRHAEYFWIFDDVKADFDELSSTSRRSPVLRSLVEKYGSCSVP
uniref:Uncharacterized protein n=1 Tax=Fagus sylvatica TaxID=28930 RepID=A0A2N9EZL5_FAGSY